MLGAGSVDDTCRQIVNGVVKSFRSTDNVSMVLIVFNQDGIVTANAGAGGGWRGFAAASRPSLRAPETCRHAPIPFPPLRPSAAVPATVPEETHDHHDAHTIAARPLTLNLPSTRAAGGSGYGSGSGSGSVAASTGAGAGAGGGTGATSSASAAAGGGGGGGSGGGSGAGTTTTAAASTFGDSDASSVSMSMSVSSVSSGAARASATPLSEMSPNADSRRHPAASFVFPCAPPLPVADDMQELAAVELGAVEVN